jgi:zinc transporter ZupT
MLILISLATFLSTLIGGLFALRFKDKLHLILGFSAGAVIGVAFFDLLPEALELGSKFYSTSIITSLVASGFVVYLILDRLVSLHTHSQGDDHDDKDKELVGDPESKYSNRGILGAGSLSIHSFIDGVAIGLSFQVSTTIGIIVAIAVLVHDFSDGINTVSLIVRNKGGNLYAFRWLIVDAVAPIVGVVSTLFFKLPEQVLGIILAIFCGFFLYIGASDLIPESHHGHPRFLTTFMTVLGVGVLYVAIKVAGV